MAPLVHAPVQRLALALLIATAAACGSGGGGGGGTPVQPVDNTPTRVDISPATAASLTSGSTVTLTATAFTRDGRSLGSAGVSWSSSNEGVASVASGLVTAKLVGSATISATAGSATGSVSVSVTPGTPSQLALRTQPAGAASGAAFTTQPVVEIRDAAGNVTPSSALSVTAALASGGGTLAGTVSVASGAGVATFVDLAISGLVGIRTLTFTAVGLTAVTSSALALAPGIATQLAIRTQPVAGTAYAVFTAPAVVEIRDAAGNAAASTAPVTASIATGGGTLAGTATVNAVAGVATFTDLAINGVAGARTLTFTSGTFSPVTSATFAVAAAPPAVIGFTPASSTLSTSLGSSPASVDIAIANTGVFPLTALRAQSTSFSPIAPAGWLAASFPSGVDAPATMRLTFSASALPVGTYVATIVVAGDGAAATRSFVVTLTVAPPVTNAYGTAANKVSFVSIGAVFSPGLVSTAGGATTTDPTVAFASRSTPVATVDATGRITGVSAGQSWVVATSAQAPADSVLVIVPPSTGVILRTDLTTWSYRVGDVISFRLQIDTRGATVGAVNMTFTWPPWIGPTGTFGALTYVDATAGTALAPQISYDATTQTVRITGASANGVTGVVDVATVRLRAARAGSSIAYVTAIELLAADLTSLIATATSTSYPIIVP